MHSATAPPGNASPPGPAVLGKVRRKTPRLSLVTTLAALSLLLGVPAASAQQQHVIADRCPDMRRIVPSRDVRIGGPADPGRIGDPTAFAIDGRGRIITSHTSARGEIHVFDASGRFLQSFGREGDGPGEYRGVIRSIFVGPGDTLHIVDSGNRRATVLSPDFKVLGTSRMPADPGPGARMVRLPSGAWIMNAAIRSPKRVGLPLHLVHTDGTIARSFGALTPLFRADAARLNQRSIALAGTNRVWAAPITEYRVELWDVSNERHRELVRDVEWFRPWIRIGRTTRDEPWPPHLWDIHLDEDGLLWTLITIPVRNWRDHLEEYAPGQFAFSSEARYFGSIVEVLDLERACVLARLETDVYLRGISSGGRFYAYDEDDLGVPYLEVWTLRLN